ncbi:hypothetical protein SAMN05444161_8939 [Rhizobiales bacterium GAS191]|nr:hypothetical protein SAMN05444161_8939 [Rhizobiales bacterium GAS191]
MGGRSRRRAFGVVVTFAGVSSILGSGEASAHVKWFCGYDVAEQPRGLASVFGEQFGQLVGLAVLVLLVGCALEGSWVGEALWRALDRVTGWLKTNTDVVIRLICAFFFVALWRAGGVILTPELKTSSTIIPWLQLAIAICLIWRRTLPFSAAGIVTLYAVSAWEYGAFHLMDYPIFLGIAAYLALYGLQRDLFGMRPVDVLRWAAGITLMWASIEKWAYPQWTFPLFTLYPEMKMGFDQELYMRAAGVVEFTLAFALLWTPLVRRAASIILAGMFISAVFEFGALDAIGHAPIVAVMLAIAADDIRPLWQRRSVMLAPLAFALALVAMLIPYYGGHAALFGTTIM